MSGARKGACHCRPVAALEPEVQKRYVEQGWIAGGAAPVEVAERFRAEAAAWKAIVERTGVKVE